MDFRLQQNWPEIDLKIAFKNMELIDPEFVPKIFHKIVNKINRDAIFPLKRSPFTLSNTEMSIIT